MIKWLWEGDHVNDADIPESAVGFIYMIEHIPTGKYYIGKKSLYSIRNLKIGKRELQRIKEERKEAGIRGSLPKKKQVKKESDWRDYMSSNKWIKEQVSDGNELDFKKKILQFCHSTKALTYYELHWQFKYNVLADENSLNDNLLGKFFRKDLEK
jgi:hypothetical protein